MNRRNPLVVGFLVGVGAIVGFGTACADFDADGLVALGGDLGPLRSRSAVSIRSWASAECR